MVVIDHAGVAGTLGRPWQPLVAVPMSIGPSVNAFPDVRHLGFAGFAEGDGSRWRE